MSIDKRIRALSHFVGRADDFADKSNKIAKELLGSFQDDKSLKGKRARRVARDALRVARAFQRLALQRLAA